MPQNVDRVHHYPPELLNQLTNAISNLVKSKDDVITFFRGAGVPAKFLIPWSTRIAADRKSVFKTAIVKDVLCKLNDLGDDGIAPRREVVKRVVQWDDFSTAYDDKRLIAQGLVASLQKLVNVKDSFTRMADERERERQEKQAIYAAEAKKKQELRETRGAVKKRLYGLFAEADPKKRGKALEGVLNDLFASYSIAVRDAFTVRGNEGEGVIAQVDGLIEYNGHLYFVEMKWLKDPVGRGEMATHLVNIYGRGDVRGLFISASEYTPAAIEDSRAALVQKVCVLADLHELVALLERDGDLKDLLQAKIVAAQADKNPYLKVLD
jgi:restriction endonuclease Mrr